MKKHFLRNKKGAVEMSMNVIIIIVIGITLLILGLTFVTGTFGKLKDMVTGVFIKYEDQIINTKDLNKALTISPETLKIKKGGDYTLHVYLKNLKESKINDVIATVTEKQKDVTCTFFDGGTTSDKYNIASGDSVDLKVLVKSNSETGTLGTKYCTFTAPSLGDNVKDTVLITVEA